MAMSGITVGVDASDNSERALEWAMREGALRNAPVTVVGVNKVATNEWTGDPITSAADAPEVAKIRQVIEEKVAKVSGKIDTPVDVHVEVVSGVASRVLVDASNNADLLVVGSRGGGGFNRLLVGSVSSQLVHHAACPVVVVR
jgi:nucleotide-binding universal stress UspA family protein